MIWDSNGRFRSRGTCKVMERISFHEKRWNSNRCSSVRKSFVAIVALTN